MEIQVDRYDCGRDTWHCSVYTVDDAAVADMTVMDLLAYITRTQDPTLAYYSHSVCGHGICKRCLMRINGRVLPACTTMAGGRSKLHLEPANRQKVVRDLVIRD